jgi:hypothetical protein
MRRALSDPVVVAVGSSWSCFGNRNPLDLVHIKDIRKRKKKPVVLDPEQCWALISALPDPYRTMALVPICTGLRVSDRSTEKVA